MPEVQEDSEVKHPRESLPVSSLTFVEVLCRSSGKVRRFSAGTEAGFAVNLINKRLVRDGGGDGGGGVKEILLASHIDAVKEDEEEPVSFGPNSVLVNYGSGWKLQTVLRSYGDKGRVHVEPTGGRKTSAKSFDASDSMRRTMQSPISLVYLGKILLAFVLIFVLGAVFTLVLENLPRFILYINSSA